MALMPLPLPLELVKTHHACGKKICQNLSYLGISIDEEINEQRGEYELSTPDSKIRVFVVPTDEEIMIARDTLDLISDEN